MSGAGATSKLGHDGLSSLAGIPAAPGPRLRQLVSEVRCSTGTAAHGGRQAARERAALGH
eukprot:scaffold11022_cov157-Isochrysis_galbana.AAC.2